MYGIFTYIDPPGTNPGLIGIVHGVFGYASTLPPEINPMVCRRRHKQATGVFGTQSDFAANVCRWVPCRGTFVTKKRPDGLGDWFFDQVFGGVVWGGCVNCFGCVAQIRH